MDMDPEEFRRAAHRVADQVADYLADLERFRVLPDLEPGQIRAQLPTHAPAAGEPIDTILDDYARLIEPNVTHWQHPGFLAYFASVASGPGILGEWLASGLNSNVMLWRNAPASTELEETVVGWLRELLGLPPSFDGMFTDTASISSLLSIVAARHALPGLDATERGLAGREGIGRLRLYGSAGPLVQFAGYDQQGVDESFDEDGSGFGTGWYGRAGLEYFTSWGTSVGIGVRYIESNIELDDFIGELDAIGMEYAITVTTEW